jgi:hypothetical protein
MYNVITFVENHDIREKHMKFVLKIIGIIQIKEWAYKWIHLLPYILTNEPKLSIFQQLLDT